MDPHQKLMGSILGQDPSSIQVLSKSVQIFCSPAHKATNHQTTGQIITSPMNVVTIKTK